MAEFIFWFFIILYVLEFLFEVVLTVLNAKYSTDPKRVVPDSVGVHLDQEKYLKTHQYTIAKSKFSIVTSTISLIILLVVLFSGFFNTFDLYLRDLVQSDIWRGVSYFMLLGLIMTLVGLPASIYQTFVLEERFGFNKITPKLFVIDLIKGLLLNAVILVPVLLGIFYFVASIGTLWWLYTATALILFQLLLMYLYPVLIAPLFNKFTPLENENLVKRIGELANRVEFPFREIQVMDGSKRSKHSNAYFTGFGKNKRIVLFDTLAEKLSDDEIIGVLAHEMGHFKHKHIIKQMFVSMGMIFVVFFLLHVVLQFPAFFQAFGIQFSSAYLGFLLFGLYFSSLTFWVSPLFSFWSRKNEFEADRFAAAHGPSGQALCDALIKLNVENLSNLFPHPLYVRFNYSHPPLLTRIKHIQEGL